MSDDFLNKLREIREKYGVCSTEFVSIELLNHNPILQTKISPSGSFQPSHQSNHQMRCSYNPSYENIIRPNEKKEFNGRSINQHDFSKFYLEEKQFKSNSLMRSKVTQKSFSQNKIPIDYISKNQENMYQKAPLSTIYNTNYDKKRLNAKNFESLKILYEPTSKPKPEQNIPEFSYARKPLEINKDCWTVNNLCRVQEKIKAYLRK